jgi:hypothetical protein
MTSEPAEQFIRLPVFPGITVKRVELAEGYMFGKPIRNTVDIINQRTQAREATVSCNCTAGSGGCALVIDTTDKSVTCVEDGCKACGMTVRVPTQAFVGYLGEVFKP